jgi:hypothetical protein
LVQHSSPFDEQLNSGGWMAGPGEQFSCFKRATGLSSAALHGLREGNAGFNFRSQRGVGMAGGSGTQGPETLFNLPRITVEERLEVFNRNFSGWLHSDSLRERAA